MKYFLAIGALFIANLSFAGCGIRDAKVTEVFQYYDGTVFVGFNKSSDCSCSQNYRMAFFENDESMDYIKSLILMAYATGKSVYALSDIADCPIHNNTAQLNYFRIKGQ